MNTQQANEIMMICARTQAVLDGNTELLDLMHEQKLDDSDKARGEYLGGNGQADWHHCKGHIIENTGYESAPTDRTHLEQAVLSYAVTEHQTSIEANGVYNVRQLARWKGGYSAEKAQDAIEANHKKLLGIRATDKRNDKLKATAESRKAKRLAKLAARRG